MGFSNSEKCFTIPPNRLRYFIKILYFNVKLVLSFVFRKAAVCTAFLTGLPEILDNNLMIGNQVSYIVNLAFMMFKFQMLPIIVQLLVHLPSPQKFASDQSAADYSLQLLDQPSRHSWLHTLILILYKV